MTYGTSIAYAQSYATMLAIERGMPAQIAYATQTTAELLPYYFKKKLVRSRVSAAQT